MCEPGVAKDVVPGPSVHSEAVQTEFGSITSTLRIIVWSRWSHAVPEPSTPISPRISKTLGVGSSGYPLVLSAKTSSPFPLMFDEYWSASKPNTSTNLF